MTSAPDSDSSSKSRDKAAHDQTILVYLLQFLHILFGVTALIGVIVCHMKKSTTMDTRYESHRIWQIWTFWTAVIGYAAGVYYIQRMGSWTIALVTLVWVTYRIIRGWHSARAHEPINPAFLK